ncbi:glutathione S-transferase theta-1-like, partial [Plectropomus leopardus]|uniref:glutathione S-transferase theta-1-like n=1 Tax=Plectropomus leopardus TaxID=160734 RepID=UPI001C4A8160
YLPKKNPSVDSGVCLQPVATGLDVFEGRPKLTAWRERVKKALGEKLFDEAHEVIMAVSSLPQKMQSSSELEMLKPKFRKIFS